jgi:hypothetical protein
LTAIPSSASDRSRIRPLASSNASPFR